MCNTTGLKGWSDEKLRREFDAQLVLRNLRREQVHAALDAARQDLRQRGYNAHVSLLEVGDALQAEVMATDLFRQLGQEFRRRGEDVRRYDEEWPARLESTSDEDAGSPEWPEWLDDDCLSERERVAFDAYFIEERLDEVVMDDSAAYHQDWRCEPG